MGRVGVSLHLGEEFTLFIVGVQGLRQVVTQLTDASKTGGEFGGFRDGRLEIHRRILWDFAGGCH